MSSLRPRDSPWDHAQREPNIIFEKPTLTVPKNQAFSEIQTITSNVVFATPSHFQNAISYWSQMPNPTAVLSAGLRLRINVYGWVREAVVN